MIPEQRGWLNALRLGLLLAGIGWGISFFFTFASWTTATDQLRSIGAQPIRYQPLLDYWLRMASAVFGCIGIAALICCVRPQPHSTLIRWFALFHLFVGGVLAVAAWNNHFTLRDEPTFPADITFCFLVAGLTGIPMAVARKEKVPQQI
jgi:drug/metabolite transporter (DMT)-like permease